MFEKEIFVGFPVDSLFEKELAKVNPNLVAAFIQKRGDEYLQDFVHEEIRYFGKRGGKNLTIAQLELIEENIYSLLKRLVPEFSYEEIPLYVFAV